MVRVVDPCPGGAPRDAASQAKYFAEQTLILPTLGAAQEYVKPELGPSSGTRLATEDQANPSDRFGAIGVAWLYGETVVFVPAVGDRSVLDAHAAALTKRVPRPDRLVVCPTVFSEGRSRQIAAEISAKYGASFGPASPLYGIDGYVGGRLIVRLRSDAADVAAEIRATYGPDVAIRRGHLLWPEGTFPATGKPYACLPFGKNAGPKIRWQLPKQVVIKAGGSTTFAFKTTNVERVTVELPKFRAVLVRPGTNQVVASDAREWLEAGGEPREVPPGGTVKLVGETFTDSCDPTLGYSVPAGRYEVRLVATSSYIGRASLDSISPAIPVRVVP